MFEKPKPKTQNCFSKTRTESVHYCQQPMIAIKCNNTTTLQLPATTNYFHALPRLASLVPINDFDSYTLLLPANDEEQETTSTSTSTPLNPTTFQQHVLQFMKDTPVRYHQLATARCDELTVQAVQSIKLSDKTKQQQIIRLMCGFIKNEKNNLAISIELLKPLIALIQSTTVSTCEVAIESLCILLTRIPVRLITLFSTEIEVDELDRTKDSKRNKLKQHTSDGKTTLMSLLFESCYNKVMSSRAAAINPERVVTNRVVELRVARLLSLVIASPPTVQPPQQEQQEHITALWNNAMVRGASQLTGLVLSLSQSKKNTNAATLALRSLSMAMFTSSMVRIEIGQIDFLPKLVVPLLAKLKDNIFIVIELFTLISVVGSSAPGEEYIGEDHVIRGLFQTIREYIPPRITHEFYGEEEAVDEEEEAAGERKEPQRLLSSLPNNNNDAQESANSNNNNNEQEEKEDEDDGGVVDMLPWSLNIKDFTPPKPSKKNKIKQPAAPTEEEKQETISPKDKMAAVSKLLKIGAYVVWRGLSSFCGVISSNKSIDDNQSMADNSMTAQRRQNNNNDSNINATRSTTTVSLRTFNHASSDDDMDLLCLLARCQNNSIRTCALGALATASSNDIMGDHVAESEDKRHHHRHVHKSINSSNNNISDSYRQQQQRQHVHHTHQRSWEDYFLDVVDQDPHAQCRLNAVSVLCSLVGASASNTNGATSGRISRANNHFVRFADGADEELDHASHVKRRIRVASNARAAHILCRCMIKENLANHPQHSTSSLLVHDEALSDSIAQRCAFVLCEMALVPDQLANRDEIYAYSTKQVNMLDHVTAKLGADTLTSLIQNEEQHEEATHSQLNHPQHPQTLVGVVNRCLSVLASLERSSSVLSIASDHSVLLRVELLVSLHRALYSMLHCTPTSLSLLVDHQRGGSSMLLRTLDMPLRHSSPALRYYCLNSLWIMCRHLKCAKHLIHKGLIQRLKNILIISTIKNDASDDANEQEEMLQVNAVHLLSWLTRGLGELHSSRTAAEEQEHRIGLQLGGISDKSQHTERRQEGRQETQQEQQQRSLRPPRSPRSPRVKSRSSNSAAASPRGSDLIDQFLINLVLSTFNVNKLYLMATALLSIAQRCVLLRSKRSVSKNKGIRIMIRLLENDSFGPEHQTSIHEYAAHALLNISTEKQFQTSICKQGLDTLLSHCGVLDGEDNLDDPGSSILLGTQNRLHQICSRCVANLNKNYKNRNQIYKAELNIRTHVTKKYLRENEARSHASPRPPSRPMSSLSMDSPRKRNLKEQQTEEPEGEKDKEESGKNNIRKDFMAWYYSSIECNEDTRDARVDGPRKNKMNQKTSTTAEESVSNPLLIREMRRPLSAMFSPSVKRPMPQTEFTRDTVTPSSFGASVGFGRPQSQMSMRSGSRRMGNSRVGNSRVGNSRMSSSRLSHVSNTFSEYSTYNSSQWNGNCDDDYDNSGGRGTSMTMNSMVSYANATDIWNLADEIDQTSQYLPPLAELDLSTLGGGEFVSPFCPAVAHVGVTKNLDYTKEDDSGEDTEVEEENDDGEEREPLTKPGKQSDQQNTANKNKEKEGHGTANDGDFENEILPQYDQTSKTLNGPQHATEHSIVLQPATPRNTMTFGNASENPRGDNPRDRETRLWSFTHVPGARVHEGTMTPYTLPDGQQKYLYKKTRIHFASLPWTDTPFPDPILPTEPPSLSLPSAIQFGPVVRKMKVEPQPSTHASKNSIDYIKDTPLNVQVVPASFQTTLVKISNTFAGPRRLKLPNNMMDLSFQSEWDIVVADKTVQKRMLDFTSNTDDAAKETQIQFQFAWCQKIMRCFYIHLHAMFVHYEIMEEHRSKINSSSNSNNNSLTQTNKLFVWLNDICGIPSNNNMQALLMVDNNAVVSCGTIMTYLLLAASTLYTNYVDLFTRLSLTLSKNVVPSLAATSIGPNYLASALKDINNSNDYYLSSLYRASHSVLPVDSFSEHLYSNPMHEMLMKYSKVLKKLYTTYATTEADLDPLEVHRAAKEDRSRAAGEVEAETVAVVAAPVKKSKKHKHASKKHQKEHGAANKKKHHHPYHHHSSNKRLKKRMSVQDWLSLLKMYKFLPAVSLSLEDQENELNAKRCFTKSLQMLINSSEQKTNATTLLYTDFLECIVWYAIKGNVYIPTSHELRGFGHSTTSVGMLHYFQHLIDVNKGKNKSKEKENEPSLEEQFDYQLIGNHFEPFPHPNDHGLWKGYQASFRDTGEGENVLKEMIYQVEMVLTLMKERMETVEHMSSSKHTRTKKKKGST